MSDYIFGPLPQRVGLSLVGYGSGGGEQQLSPDFSFVIQACGPHFRPAVNILLIDFGEGGSCYRGKTKSTPRLQVLV